MKRAIGLAVGGLILGLVVVLGATGEPRETRADLGYRGYLPLILAVQATPTADPPGPTATPTPTPTATATATATPIPSAFSVIRSRVCQSGSYTYVYGELQNDAGRPAFSVKASVTFYRADSSVAGAAYAYAHRDDLLPGQRSTFTILSQPQAGWTRYELAISDSYYDWLTVRTTPYLPVSGVNSWAETWTYNVAGQVTNNTGQPVEYVKVMAVLKDASGGFLSTDYVYSNPSALAPGASAPFQIAVWRSGCESDVAGYEVYAIGDHE